METIIDFFLICSAGEGIGKGHFTRVISVLEVIKKKSNTNAALFIYGKDLESLNNNNIKFTQFPSLENLYNHLLSIDFKSKKQVFIFDLKEDLINSNFEKILLKIQVNNGIIVSIDGLLLFEKFIDYFFMPTFHKQDKFDLINKEKISWGWNNFLLNSKYENAMNTGTLKNILILTGGSDATKLGQTLPKSIDLNFRKKENIKWVIGPFSNYPNIDILENNQWQFIKSPSYLDDLMLETKIAITVFGVSFFELLYYGIPTIVFSPYGLKDNKELQEIEKLGVAVVAKDESDVVVKLNELYINEFKQRELAEKSKNLFSFKGQDILYQEIKKLVEKKWHLHI